jgi:Holliday junction resolvasome RuvABC DNA-binding subunit
VPYDFDGLVGFNHPRYLTQALSAARALKARTITIVGYRGAVRLSNGETMVEAPDIGKRRAEQVAMLLKGAGLTAPSYTVRWQTQPAKATGVDDYLARRVEISIGR